MQQHFALEGAGIAVTRAFANIGDDAVRAAAEIVYLVAVKALGPTIVHKGESGGMKLAIDGERGVRDAVDELPTRARCRDRLTRFPDETSA